MSSSYKGGDPDTEKESCVQSRRRGSHDNQTQDQRMSDGKVVWLEFKSPHMDDDMMSFICCGHCRNKTYTLTEDRFDSFPLLP